MDPLAPGGLLYNLPTNPINWAALSPVPAAAYTSSPAAPRGITAWLAQNSTAVYAVAGALFVLALFGGRR